MPSVLIWFILTSAHSAILLDAPEPLPGCPGILAGTGSAPDVVSIVSGARRRLAAPTSPAS